jgi:hypothetical protein
MPPSAAEVATSNPVRRRLQPAGDGAVFSMSALVDGVIFAVISIAGQLFFEVCVYVCEAKRYKNRDLRAYKSTDIYDIWYFSIEVC